MSAPAGGALPCAVGTRPLSCIYCRDIFWEGNMKLCDLIGPTEYLCSLARPHTAVCGVTYHSCRAGRGWLFAAIRGQHTDGHRFVRQALAQGAVCLIDDPSFLAPGCLLVPRVSRAAALISARLYGCPAEGLHLVAVTGTAGKTGVCTLIAAMLAATGQRCGVIGTVENAESELGSLLTTPLPPDLHRALAMMRAHGDRYAVLEASSQALDQDRLYGLTFDASVFTNLGRDHLDYHKTTEAYFAAKASLFRQCRRAAFNADDPHGSALAAQFPGAVTFSLAGAGEVTASHITPDGPLTRFTLRLGRQRLAAFSGPGRYSVSNTLAAAAAVSLLGIDPAPYFAGGRPADAAGRMEPVPLGAPFSLYIDFAHTPEELTCAIEAARQLAGSGRVLALFGCGGDRDRGKRPEMAAVSCRTADLTVLTTCNPRSEPPLSILADMRRGVPAGARCAVIPDRRRAIEFCMRAAQPGDLILLAGKGHEMYQLVGGRSLPFNERIEAQSIWDRLCAAGTPAG